MTLNDKKPECDKDDNPIAITSCFLSERQDTLFTS